MNRYRALLIKQATCYRPSNKFEPRLLRWHIAGSVVVSVVFAVVLDFLYQQAAYWAYFGATVISIAMMFCSWWLVVRTKCRSPKIAGRIGFLTGLGCYVGFIGLSAYHEYGRLPDPQTIVEYFWLRIDNHTRVDTLPETRFFAAPSHLTNVVSLIYEFCMLVFATAWITSLSGTRTFCEICDRPTGGREVCELKVREGTRLINAWIDHDIKSFVLQRQLLDPFASGKYHAIVEYCELARGSSSLDHPVYLSVTDYGFSVHRMVLKPGEAFELLPLFPKLHALVSNYLGITPSANIVVEETFASRTYHE